MNMKETRCIVVGREAHGSEERSAAHRRYIRTQFVALQNLLNSPMANALICLWDKGCNRWLTYCQLDLVVSDQLILYDGVEVMDDGFCR